jgi:alkylation response protein AidB-like acyl-CoA dehydrogenase
LLYYRNAERRLAGRTRLPEAAMMKLALSEAWVHSCEDQLEAFGIAGQGCDLSLQTELHDALGSRIYSGTSQIQRDLVAQHLKL